jgi:hypothetical protein
MDSDTITDIIFVVVAFFGVAALIAVLMWVLP